MKTNQSLKGYSLVELLTSMTILIFILASTTTIVSQSQKVWASSTDRVSQFRDARLAFELITRNLSQSTLNTYWDYVFDNNDIPTGYNRKSELQFYSGETAQALAGVSDDTNPTHSVFFQAILGETDDVELQRLNSLLNARGYFIEFGDDLDFSPNFIQQLRAGTDQRRRFRLMELRPPSENNLVYQSDFENSENGTSINEWFSSIETRDFARPIVENVIALIVSPKEPVDVGDTTQDPYEIAPDFEFDSRDESNELTFNLLPPLVEITLVAISEQSAEALQEEFGQSPPSNLISPQLFRRAEDITQDIETLEQSLVTNNIQYRIFSTTVPIRSAKWSP